ncbi:MAG: hypothetical protein AAF694_00080 [Bacteroidota bacterium]
MDSYFSVQADYNTVIHQMKSGIGASWHAIEEPIQGHGGSAWGANPRPENEAAWESIYQHASWLAMGFCRVELEQRMYQPQRDTFTFEGYEMRILYRILDWCEAHQTDVFLQQMWSNIRWNAHDSLLGSPNSVLKSSPKNLNAFAEGMVALVEYLTQVKGYTCIKYLCLTNEPGHAWSWFQDGEMKPDNLTKALKCVHEKLKAAGIDLPLAGPDWTDLPELDESLIDFDPYIGAYDIHSYNANFDWRKEGFASSDWPLGGYPLSTAIERLKDWVQYAHERGKPFFLSEMGSMQFGWGGDHPGPGRFDAGLKDVQTLIRGMNIGVDAFNRWSFNNRGNLDGQWQLIDTWNPAEICLLDQFSPHPNVYYLYGLISRLTPKGSEVHASEVNGGNDGTYQRIFAACIGKNGVKNLYLTNDSAHSFSGLVEWISPDTDPLFVYEVRQDKHSKQVEVDTTPTPIKRVGNEISLQLAPKSLCIISNIFLSHTDPGIL